MSFSSFSSFSFSSFCGWMQPSVCSDHPTTAVPVPVPVSVSVPVTVAVAVTTGAVGAVGGVVIDPLVVRGLQLYV